MLRICAVQMVLVLVVAVHTGKDIYRKVAEMFLPLCGTYDAIIKSNLGVCFLNYAESHGACLMEALCGTKGKADPTLAAKFGKILCHQENGVKQFEQALIKLNTVCNANPYRMLKVAKNAFRFCNKQKAKHKKKM